MLLFIPRSLSFTWLSCEPVHFYRDDMDGHFCGFFVRRGPKLRSVR